MEAPKQTCRFFIGFKRFVGVPSGTKLGPSGNLMGPGGDHVGTKWDQLATKCGPNGTKWGPSRDQMGRSRDQEQKCLFFICVRKVFGSTKSKNDDCSMVLKRFWRSQGPIFRGFCMALHALALEWRGCSDPYKTLAGVVQNAHRSMSAIERATQKTNKNRPNSFLDKVFC